MLRSDIDLQPVDRGRSDRPAAAAAAASVSAITVHCADCGTEIRWSGVGQPKLRCATCAPIHSRAVQRTRRSGRSVEDEKARETAGTVRQCVMCGAPLAAKVHQKRCQSGNLDHQRVYHRAWRYGTSIAEEAERERAARCRICGERPSHLNKQSCDTCTESARRSCAYAVPVTTNRPGPSV
jgi:ribosomal protein L37E